MPRSLLFFTECTDTSLDVHLRLLLSTYILEPILEQVHPRRKLKVLFVAWFLESAQFSLFHYLLRHAIFGTSQ